MNNSNLKTTYRKNAGENMDYVSKFVAGSSDDPEKVVKALQEEEPEIYREALANPYIHLVAHDPRLPARFIRQLADHVLETLSAPASVKHAEDATLTACMLLENPNIPGEYVKRFAVLDNDVIKNKLARTANAPEQSVHNVFTIYDADPDRHYMLKPIEKLTLADAGQWRKDSIQDDVQLERSPDEYLQNELTRQEIVRKRNYEDKKKFLNDFIFPREHFRMVFDDLRQGLEKAGKNPVQAWETAVDKMVEIGESVMLNTKYHKLMISDPDEISFSDIDTYRQKNPYHCSWMEKMDRDRLEATVALSRLRQLRGFHDTYSGFMSAIRKKYPEDFEFIKKSQDIKTSVEPMRTKLFTQTVQRFVKQAETTGEKPQLRRGQRL